MVFRTPNLKPQTVNDCQTDTEKHLSYLAKITYNWQHTQRFGKTYIILLLSKRHVKALSVQTTGDFIACGRNSHADKLKNI